MTDVDADRKKPEHLDNDFEYETFYVYNISAANRWCYFYFSQPILAKFVLTKWSLLL